MKPPKAKIISPLIIIVIGLPQVGKTTALHFLLDCLEDMGIKQIGILETLIEDVPLVADKIYLVENLNSLELIELLRANYNTLILRIRGEGPSLFLDNGLAWIENCKADLVLANDDNLRRFEFTVRDAVKNIFPELKQWKQSIISSI